MRVATRIATQEEKKKKRERESSQERELCMEKKIKKIIKKKKKKKKKSKVLPPFRKIVSVCGSKENKRDFFFNCEIYTKIIIIDLIIVKLFGVCPIVLPFKKKEFST